MFSYVTYITYFFYCLVWLILWLVNIDALIIIVECLLYETIYFDKGQYRRCELTH